MSRFMPVLALLLLAPLAASGAVTGRDILSGAPVAVAPGKGGTVVAFLSAKCPCSNSHLAVLRDLAKSFPEFSFVGVHSNSDEPTKTASGYFRSAALPFPVLQDDSAKLADEFHAYKTPHVFVLTPDGKVAYRGGATNSADTGRATKFHLRDALTEIRSGRAVSAPEARTLGCVISR